MISANLGLDGERNVVREDITNSMRWLTSLMAESRRTAMSVKVGKK